MLKALLRNVTFFAFTALNLIYAYRALKHEVTKLADTDKASNKFHYIAIRAARGEYLNWDYPAMIRYDLKFYGTETVFNSGDYERTIEEMARIKEKFAK